MTPMPDDGVVGRAFVVAEIQKKWPEAHDFSWLSHGDIEYLNFVDGSNKRRIGFERDHIDDGSEGMLRAILKRSAEAWRRE
jgi:hypothetical protein